MYASFQDLGGRAGVARLLDLAGTDDPSEVGPLVSSALSAASARMNAAFSRAGYAVPIALETVGIDLRQQLEDQLKTVCCAIAAGTLQLAVDRESDVLNEHEKRALDWLDNVASGKELLLGVPRDPATQARQRTGRIAAVPTGDTLIQRHTVNLWDSLHKRRGW